MALSSGSPLRFRRVGTYTIDMLLQDLRELDDIVVLMQGGINNGSLKGDKGDKGDQGIQGTPGVTGPAGPRGLQGIQGTRGLQGERGLDGVDSVDNPYDRGRIDTDFGLITDPVDYQVDYGFIDADAGS